MKEFISILQQVRVQILLTGKPSVFLVWAGSVSRNKEEQLWEEERKDRAERKKSDLNVIRAEDT
jgi:hemolysin-activating ACP:hemolysin acyltransferase